MTFSKRHFVSLFLPAVALALLFTYSNSRPAALPAHLPQPAVGKLPEAALTVDHDLQASVGVEFEFLPTVSNPAHDRLQFSAENLPPWASIDPASGRVMGKPQAADIGQYESITITMTADGQRVATRPFNISVMGTATAPAVATLEWRAPMSKFDGSPLDDLAGYRIAYGHDPEFLDHSIFIADPAQTSYAFSTLESGVWYFALIAVNTNGLESPPTTPARKSI